ncbi:MAG: gluconate 2-dehydrogenase subunit 3 family protein [Gemmatimonadaceae bacterium]
MERRDLLRALASAAALTVLPHQAAAAWERVATGLRLTSGLNDAQMALVKAVADTIIPRTDTPSATDVGVHDFVNVIVSEQLSDADRTAALAGLDAIDAFAKTEKGAAFAGLDAAARGAVIEKLESGSRDSAPARTYWRLKGLVVHGYFTSEPVMKDVLKHRIMPGRFEGAAPVQIKPRQTGSPKPAEDAHA